MKKRTKLTVWLAVVALMGAGLPTAMQAQIHPLRLCCVSGEYAGSHVNNPMPNCPPPKSEKFTMTLKQGVNCAENVWGTITGPPGDVNNFTGTLRRGLRGCCVLTASFGTRGHVTTFTGTFCQRMGKWYAKGTYTETGSSDPCKVAGTWEANSI